MHPTTSTYTFNYCHFSNDNVKGEIRKKTLLTEGTRFNNKLAPKFRSLSTSMPQIGALVPIKINKSEHYNPRNNLTFNETCEVSLDTILFIERMNKIEDNRSTLYKIAFSTNSLLVAYDQIKSKPGNLTPGQGKETLKGINLKWFKTSSNKLLKGLFVYPKMRRVSIPKKLGSTGTRPLTLTSPRIKIIERSILNALEPIFEGKFQWKSITKSEYDFIKKKNNNIVVINNKSGYFKKDWINPPIFSRFSFGFRPSRSAHGALHLIKSWPTNLGWFIKFDIVKAFDTVNRNRLKNIFFKNCLDHRIWNEINKLLKTEIVDLKTTSSNDLGVSQGSVLSPFLFNIYMTELDNFIESLKLKYNETSSESGRDPSVKSEYERFARKFRTKRGLSTTLAECGSPELVLASYKKERSAFFKKYGSTSGENKTLRRITYVRYADDFIIGITGSRDFALKIATKIESFIKSDLHLRVHDVILTSRDKGAVKFLGFNIYLSSIKNKAKTKSNKIKSIDKYKKRSLARLKGNDARISQAYFNSIKHGFLNYLQNVYERLNLKKDKKTDELLIKNFINKNLEELLLINSQQQTTATNYNLALRRYTQHFKDLFSKNIDISLKIWEENFIKLEPFNENFVLTKELSKVIKARDKFLAELKSIENSVIDKTREAAKEEAIKLYRQKQSLKFFHKSPFSKFSEREFARAAELLSLRTMDITRSRRISIRVDIKNFYSKLTDLGFYSTKRKSPLSVPKLIFLNDYEIISFYNTLIRGYLNWFRCADNFTSAKNIIWTLRISCLKTLARKHKKNLKWALTIFTINVTTESPNGKSFNLPSTHEISQLSTKFLLENQFQQPDAQSLLNKYSLRLHSSRHLFSKCAVNGCSNADIEIHHVKKLGRRIDANGKISVVTSNNKRLSGISAILSAVNRKQIPLCSFHHLEFETGNYSPLDIKLFKKIYSVDC
jgi:retron-type reverse transcriptase